MVMRRRGLIRRSAKTDKELQATLLALNAFPRTVLTQYRRALKQMALPAWQVEVRRNARSKLETRVLSATARVTVSNQNVTLTSGSSTRRMKGGGTPKGLAKTVEFGGSEPQFKAPRRGGYVVYKAAAKFIPRAASLITQTVVRTFHEAIEGKK